MSFFFWTQLLLVLVRVSPVVRCSFTSSQDLEVLFLFLTVSITNFGGVCSVFTELYGHQSFNFLKSFNDCFLHLEVVFNLCHWFISWSILPVTVLSMVYLYFPSFFICLIKIYVLLGLAIMKFSLWTSFLVDAFTSMACAGRISSYAYFISDDGDLVDLIILFSVVCLFSQLVKDFPCLALMLYMYKYIHIALVLGLNIIHSGFDSIRGYSFLFLLPFIQVIPSWSVFLQRKCSFFLSGV